MGQIRFTLDGVDTTPPVLSAASAIASGTTAANWAVTSDEAGGTIFVAARLSNGPVLTRTQIEAGTGGAVATGSDTSPTANGSNSGALSGLSPATTYRVDIFQRDANGNESAVLSSVPFTTNSASGASVSIDILQQSGLAAPQGAFFEAHVAGFDETENLDLNQYDPSFGRLRYHWTVQRQGQSYSARPAAKVVNLPAAHNDSNTAYGKRVGHSFTDPGTYTITCEVRDQSGNTASATTTITVADPDAVFPGNRTILLGNADAAYPGAQIATSLLDARTRLNALGNTGRILIARGTDLSGTSIGFIQTSPNVYIGAYGTGARPVIGVAGSLALDFGTNFTGDIQLIGLELRGGWDSVNETGNGGGLGIRCQSTTNIQRMILEDCHITGWGEAMRAPLEQGGTTPHAAYIHDCDFSGNRFYSGNGIVAESPGSFHCVTGSYLGNLPDDMMGGPKDGNYNNHGSIRYTGTGYAYMAVCDLFTRVGWNPSTAEPTAAGPVIQPCIRWSTSNRPGSSGVFERIAMEGGFSFTAGGARSFGSNLLIEKCLFLGHSSLLEHVSIQSPGCTIRNNIMVHPNAPTSTGQSRFGVSVGAHPNPPQPDASWPCEVYSNTFVTLMDDSNILSGSVVHERNLGGFDTITYTNNIIDTPNLTGGEGEAGLNLSQTRMPTAGGLHDPWWLGARWRASTSVNGEQLTMDTTYATPNDTVKEFRPGAGSAALASATGTLCAIDDFYGTLRPVTVASRSRGAVEA